MSSVEEIMLDEAVLLQRLKEFTPEPLVDTKNVKNREEIEIPMVIEDENNIDLAKVNFLGVLNDESIKKVSEDVIRKYGVGTCGPRAFYGTTDVHLDLEQLIADFLLMEESIVYSYGFVAISSSIAAYCKRNDIVFIDSNANFPILQGLLASKSQIVYFDHNDPGDFEKKAKEINNTEKNKSRRKFLIVEAVSWKTGKVLPLKEFIDIAETFKMRIFLEESYSIGVFGQNGRGLTEHFNIEPTKVDMIFGTLEGALGSIGGFCAGSHLAIEHQRLSGSGYIFSASLPTYLVQACIESIKSIENKPETLRNFAKTFHNFLEEKCNFKVSSDPECAFKVFNGKNNDKIYDFCKENGLHFIKNEQSLVINLNVSLLDQKSRLEKVYEVLEKASKL